MAVIVVTTASSEILDHLEAAWGVIANANHGDWSLLGAEWREAAETWRDRYHELLDLHLDARDRWEQEVFGPF
jgi:hypothetical protein